jgi:hypothetical protein
MQTVVLCLAFLLGGAALAAEEPKLSTRVLVGPGWSAEAETGTHHASDLGLQADVRLSPLFRATGAYRASLHEQTYVSLHPDVSGMEPGRSTVAEGEHDIRIGASIDLPLPTTLDEVSSASASLGPRWLTLANPLFPSTSVAMRIGADVSFRPVEHLRLNGMLGLAPRLFGSAPNLSALGRSRALWDAQLGAAIEFGEAQTWALELVWNLDSNVLEHTVRTRNSALAGISFSR